jgi:indolepyruvate ferredoxin oxidoreductase beta subunit
VDALPPAARDLAGEGVRRTLDYQDPAYAATYVERVEALAAQPGATPGLIRETARFLALWMCYEDIARVAQLKTKPARFVRVRSEAGARDDEPIRVVEYLRPGAAEVADMLPPAAARWLRRRAAARAGVAPGGGGIHVDTTSITGYALLRALSTLRRVRRASSRFHDEQQRIEAWLASIHAALASGDAALALEIALCARLIKGYGDTHERGIANFEQSTAPARDASIAPAARAAAVRAAREAALANGGDGSPSRTPKATPIRFLARRPRGA